MDKVILDGKEYIRSALAAKSLHYTTDYIGQLCRAKKIDARLVGRSWYVHLPSAEDHKSEKKKRKSQPISDKLCASEKSDQPKCYADRRHVEPLLSKKTLKVVKQGPQDRQVFARVHYENDDYSLLPDLSKPTASALLPVTPAEASVVSVRDRSSSAQVFHPSDLPTVALSGTLKVTEPATEEDIPSSRDTSKNKLKKVSSSEIKVTGGRVKSIKLKRLDVALQTLSEEPKKASTPTHPVVYRQRSTNQIPVQKLATEKEDLQISIFYRYSPLLALFLGLVLSLFFVGLRSETTVAFGTVFSTTNFSTASVFEALYFYTQLK